MADDNGGRRQRGRKNAGRDGGTRAEGARQNGADRASESGANGAAKAEAGKGSGAPSEAGRGNGTSQPQGCTQAQLRRFIKSRAYVPMHELRRRFAINGEADDVFVVQTQEGRYWAGLPARESGFLAELVDRGEVGLELCHDPCVDMIIGVYAIRPVSR